jgi:presenilin-like A22 family membrane protease
MKGNQFLAMGMSPDATASNDNPIQRKSEFQYVIEAMKEQWVSMVGMMAMFVVTIGLGMLLQPFYNQTDELRAFGTEGASQGRWIIMELAMIFVFTAVIIWLAKKKKEWVIKLGILAILWLALVYATVPLAHLLLAPDMGPEPFVDEFSNTEEAVENGTFVLHHGAEGYMMYNIIPTLNESGEQVLDDKNNNLSSHTLSMKNGNSSWNWHADIPTNQYTLRVTPQSENYIISAGEDLWILDLNGNELSNDTCFRATYPAGCSVSFTHNYNDEDYTYTITDEPRLIRFDPYGKGNYTNPVKDAQWIISEELSMREPPFLTQKFDDDRFMVVTSNYAVLFNIPETSSPPVLGRDTPADLVEEIWNYSTPNGVNISAAEWGVSPWSESTLEEHNGREMMLIIGTDTGDVMSWNFNLDNNEVEEEDRMNLAGNDAVEGNIHAIRLGDYGDGGVNEIFIASGDTLHMFHGTSLVDYMHINLESTPEAIHIIAKDDGAVVSWFGEESWAGGMLDESMLKQQGIILDNLSSIVGLLTATLLMAWLIWKPEWYVVNTTGILVGSGVVVMLGIAFVPWLVIFFMILAAIYDHWAVHKSKHMLDLADTMIGLKLPILLVAPQEKGFSMLDDEEIALASTPDKVDEETEEIEYTEKDDAIGEAAAKKEGFKAKAIAADAAQKSGKKPAKKGNSEAMFMGLGDIIFPGMLVISAMTYLAPIGGENAALLVAIGVIIGGLCGYLFLMTRVALGIPQAGLPLLNGGSIVGFFVSGLIFIGWKAFEFNVTF